MEEVLVEKNRRASASWRNSASLIYDLRVSGSRLLQLYFVFGVRPSSRERERVVQYLGSVGPKPNRRHDPDTRSSDAQ